MTTEGLDLEAEGVPADVAEWVRETYYPQAWPIWLRSWRQDPQHVERMARLPEGGS